MLDAGHGVSPPKLADAALDALAREGFVIVEIGSEEVARRHRRAIALLHRLENEGGEEGGSVNVVRLPARQTRP
jgi:hypothetical protein